MDKKQEAITAIGQRIKELREAKGLSFRQLAELSGVNHANIYKMEKGELNPSIGVLTRILEPLGANIHLL